MAGTQQGVTITHAKRRRARHWWAGLWALLVLCLFLGLQAGTAVAQADPTTDEARLRAEIDRYGALFDYIDVFDMRALRASMVGVRQSAEECRAGACPDFDCAAAARSARELAEFITRMDVFASGMDHLHGLSIDLMTRFHEEANIAQDTVDQAANIAFWQSSVLRISALVIQMNILLLDVRDGMSIDAGRFRVLRQVSAADEIARDLLGLLQDSDVYYRTAAESVAFRETVSLTPVVGTYDRIGTTKSNLNNIGEALEAQNRLADLAPENLSEIRAQRAKLSANLVALLGRELRDVALREMARREAEVQALREVAGRERTEADAFFERVLAMRVQADAARDIVRQGYEALIMLDNCVWTRCALTPLNVPEVPQVIVSPSPRDVIQRPILDGEEMRRNADRALFLGLGLDVRWVRPVCTPEDAPEAPRVSSVTDPEPAGPPAQGAFAFTEQDRAVHGCTNLLPELRAACFDAFLQIRVMEAELQSVGAVGAGLRPDTPAFNKWGVSLCQSICRMQSTLDTALDTYRAQAARHVALVVAETAVATSGGADLLDGDAELQQMVQALRERRYATARNGDDVYYVPGMDANVAVTSGSGPPSPESIFLASRIGEATGAEAEEQEEMRRAIADRIAVLAEARRGMAGTWGQEALDFWQRYGDHQMMRCGGETLVERRTSCEFLCGSTPFSAGNYRMCSVDATQWSFIAADYLYPPGDSRRDSVIDLRVALPPTGR